MSLLDRLTRLLDRGEVSEPPPDAVVELVNVSLHEGPRLLQVLESAGIKATGVDSADVVTDAMTRTRIFVRQGDVPRATDVLRDYGEQSRST